MTDRVTAAGAAGGAALGATAIIVADSIRKELAEGDTRDRGGLIAAGAGVGAGLSAAAVRRMG